jgi:hypothetical protein
MGGIRLPPIDVPVARYETTVCGLGGITVPFTDPEIHALYPTHADYVARMQARTDAAGNYGAEITPLLATCTVAGATMPMHYATSTAIHDLNEWVAGKPAPPAGPRFRFDASGALAKDRYGNALGGIRLPPIDVPVARYETTVCGLGGVTVPFTDPEIHALYPTHADYVAQMQARTDAAVQGGWLLPPDGRDLMRRACDASNRWSTPPAAACAAA